MFVRKLRVPSLASFSSYSGGFSSSVANALRSRTTWYTSSCRANSSTDSPLSPPASSFASYSPASLFASNFPASFYASYYPAARRFPISLYDTLSRTKQATSVVSVPVVSRLTSTHKSSATFSAKMAASPSNSPVTRMKFFARFSVLQQFVSFPTPTFSPFSRLIANMSATSSLAIFAWMNWSLANVSAPNPHIPKAPSSCLFSFHFHCPAPNWPKWYSLTFPGTTHAPSSVFVQFVSSATATNSSPIFLSNADMSASSIRPSSSSDVARMNSYARFPVFRQFVAVPASTDVFGFSTSEAKLRTSPSSSQETRMNFTA